MERIDHNSFKPRGVYAVSDKPDINPFDTSPKTPQEAQHAMKVEAAIQGMVRALRKHRGRVTLQIAAYSKNVRVNLDGELPRIDGIRHGMFFFSVCGEYQGKKWGPCLIDEDCMLISAASPADARRIAREGLHDTIEAAQRYAFSQKLHSDIEAHNVVARNGGMSIDAEIRGRR